LVIDRFPAILTPARCGPRKLPEAAPRARESPTAETEIETLDSPAGTATARTGRGAAPRILTAAVRVQNPSPRAFLRAVAGESRGFWARGERWAAHAGALATLEVSADGAAVGRFRLVADGARVWTSAPRSDAPGIDASLAGRLRFYGGFAFRDDHHPSGFWEAFPPALFVLPALELEGEGDGVARLRARAVVPAHLDPADALMDLQRTLVCAQEGMTERGPRRSPGEVAEERTEMGRVTWADAVGQALSEIAGGRFSKVVLARTLDVTTAEPLDPADVVHDLWRQNPRTHAFLFEPRPGRPFLGAAPETVATLRRGDFHATAVAGSTRRGESDEESRALAAKLLASAKDREEHAIARQDMVARLRSLAEDVRADEEPHVLTLARIQHLESEIRARVHGRTVLELLEALHPTPAVCGYPRDAALEFLRGEEPFDRGWYAGPVGFFDEEGNGAFAPALRSAVAHGRTWRLFAGAGIVAGSRPELEWEETGIKFEPVLSALEASGAGADTATDPREPRGHVR
jgi:menaquinone-specific isochorismate synthase